MEARVAEAHARLVEAEERVVELRAARDREIRTAIRGGWTMYSIAKRLGISQSAVRKIRDAPRS